MEKQLYIMAAMRLKSASGNDDYEGDDNDDDNVDVEKCKLIVMC